MASSSISEIAEAGVVLDRHLMTIFSLADPDKADFEAARGAIAGAIQRLNGAIVSALEDLDARIQKLEKS